MKKVLMTLMLCLGVGSVVVAQQETPVRDEIDFPIKLIHGPYLQNLGTDEVTIVWEADRPSVGWVEWAPEGTESFYNVERPRKYDARNGVKVTSKVHVVTLKGLQPGTKYRYRVYAQEVLHHRGNRVFYGNTVATNVYTKRPLEFCTADNTKQKVSFAIVNDIHGDTAKLSRLINKCELNKTDFFIFNGDMVSQFNTSEQVFSGFMDKAVELFASQVPMYYTRGNHETRGEFATEFQRYFSPKESNIYYTFRQGPICFVILDTGEDKPDTDIEYAGITVYDEYRTEQAKWLQEVLESKAYKEAPFKVIVAHIPPTDDWHGAVEVDQKFMPLLRQAKPDIMFCAHEHSFMHHQPTSQTPFPILVNSHTAVVKVVAGEGEMKVEVVDQDGKMVDSFVVKTK